MALRSSSRQLSGAFNHSTSPLSGSLSRRLLLIVLCLVMAVPMQGGRVRWSEGPAISLITQPLLGRQSPDVSFNDCHQIAASKHQDKGERDVEQTRNARR